MSIKAACDPTQSSIASAEKNSDELRSGPESRVTEIYNRFKELKASGDLEKYRKKPTPESKSQLTSPGSSQKNPRSSGS